MARWGAGWPGGWDLGFLGQAGVQAGGCTRRLLDEGFLTHSTPRRCRRILGNLFLCWPTFNKHKYVFNTRVGLGGPIG